MDGLSIFETAPILGLPHGTVIRLHMLSDEKSSMPTAELAEDLIGLVRAYLK
jgi:hypothetical protein